MIENRASIPAKGGMARSLPWSLVAVGICLIFLALSLYLHGRTGVRYSSLYRDANGLCCTKPLMSEVPLSPDGFIPRFL